MVEESKITRYAARTLCDYGDAIRRSLSAFVPLAQGITGQSNNKTSLNTTVDAEEGKNERERVL